MAVSSSEREEVVRLIVADAIATMGAACEGHVLWIAKRRALELLEFVGTAHDFRQRLVDDVQQTIHDTFLDVSWPRCPRHPNHPLWFAVDHWKCTMENVTIATLGQLHSASASKE